MLFVPFSELYVALLVNRIDVSEHALYRTRKANLDILLGIKSKHYLNVHTIAK